MNQVHPNQGQNNPPGPPQPIEHHYRFRWPLLAIPLAILAFFWLFNGLERSFEFDAILEYLRVSHEDKFVRLACLGTVLIAATLIVKVMRHNSK
jgi:hypothetical protein